MNLEQYYPQIALTLILGGLAVLGAAVGVRVGYGIMLEHIECNRTIIHATPCQQAAMAMNDTMIKIMFAGATVLVSGLFAQFQLNQEAQHASDA